MRNVIRGLSSSLVLLVSLAGCETGTSLGETRSDLTAEQCLYFDEGGTTQICHATGSITNPYVILKVSGRACISAHANHDGDYIAVGDPTCGGQGCLPSAAPCDATAPCCDGLSCSNGTCQPVANCATYGYADASASGCSCPNGDLTCYSPDPGVGIFCVDPASGAPEYAAVAGATCGPFQCQQYNWTSSDCNCTDNGKQPVACVDQNGSLTCHWREGTGYGGVYGNDLLLSCP